MRWIVWDKRGEIPDDVFEQCMLVVRRMLGQGDGSPGGRGPTGAARPA
jgi:hypothetical protein